MAEIVFGVLSVAAVMCFWRFYCSWRIWSDSASGEYLDEGVGDGLSDIHWPSLAFAILFAFCAYLSGFWLAPGCC